MTIIDINEEVREEYLESRGLLEDKTAYCRVCGATIRYCDKDLHHEKEKSYCYTHEYDMLYCPFCNSLVVVRDKKK